MNGAICMLRHSGRTLLIAGSMAIGTAAPAQQAAHGSLLVGAVVVQPCRISSDQAAGNCGQYHYRMVKSSSDNGTVVSLRSGNMDHSRQDDILSYEF